MENDNEFDAFINEVTEKYLSMTKKEFEKDINENNDEDLVALVCHAKINGTGKLTPVAENIRRNIKNKKTEYYRGD